MSLVADKQISFFKNRGLEPSEGIFQVKPNLVSNFHNLIDQTYRRFHVESQRFLKCETKHTEPMSNYILNLRDLLYRQLHYVENQQ